MTSFLRYNCFTVRKPGPRTLCITDIAGTTAICLILVFAAHLGCPTVDIYSGAATKTSEYAPPYAAPYFQKGLITHYISFCLDYPAENCEVTPPLRGETRSEGYILHDQTVEQETKTEANPSN